jgi:ketosteroid isomerase-like protein
MDRRSAIQLCGVGATLLAIVGCNSSTAPPPTSSVPKSTVGAPELVGPGGPADAVREFLEAVRVGNDKKAATMLTPVAREKTAEMHMVVAPPGSDTAKYQVGDVEAVEGGAHVASTWTDVDGEGKQHSDPILWILRKEVEGWRIAGMATKIFEDELPIILNFEDPEDMIRKQKLAEEEMNRRAERAEAQSVAEKPASEEKRQ